MKQNRIAPESGEELARTTSSKSVAGQVGTCWAIRWEESLQQAATAIAARLASRAPRRAKQTVRKPPSRPGRSASRGSALWLASMKSTNALSSPSGDDNVRHCAAGRDTAPCGCACGRPAADHHHRAVVTFDIAEWSCSWTDASSLPSTEDAAPLVSSLWAGQVVGDVADHDAGGEEESCFQA